MSAPSAHSQRLTGISFRSPDFCSNGLRLGVLVMPHNPRLIRTMAQTSMLMKVSSPADVLFSALLTSPRSPTASSATFLDWFIRENRRRLTDAHALVRTWFERRAVRVANSNAGHFCWVQLGERMGWTTLAEEKKGFQQLLDGGVYLGQSPALSSSADECARLTSLALWCSHAAPGSAYNERRPGWMRVTFAVDRMTLSKGLARVEAILDLRPIPAGARTRM